MALDLDAFMANSEQLALRFDSKELPGLLSKELTVPAGAAALITEAGDERCLGAGEKVGGSFKAMLVKTSVQRLQFDFAGLTSQDGLSLELSFVISLAPRPVELDLVQLRDNLFSGESSIGGATVQSYFDPSVRSAIGFFCGDHSAADLVGESQRAGVYQHLRQELQKPLFETGLDLKDVRDLVFGSSDYESRQRESAAAAQAQVAVKREQELELLRKELDKEILFKDIEARDQADRLRKEHRLERYQEMRERMGDNDLKALVMMLDDDDRRSALIKELIEKDLSPEQKASVTANEIEARLEERLREYQEQVSALTGMAVEARRDDPVVERVLCVVGKRVLAYDPSTNLNPEVAKEVYETADAGLGYLRSVRQQQLDGQSVILMGAQRGIYTLRNQRLTPYPFPTPPQGKGGANSVSCVGGRIYATHSELGVVEWDFDKPDAGRSVFEWCTDGNSSTRGVTTGYDGRVYFSSGNRIFACDILTEDRNEVYKGAKDSITAFHVERKKLYAGTKTGQILVWDLADPNSPEEYPIKKKNSIYMLRVAQIAGRDHLIIGSKDFTVSVAAPEKELYREYRAREEVRWVDGAGDYVIGVSRSGYKLFAWEVETQSKPALTVRVSDKIQDLFVVRGAKSH